MVSDVMMSAQNSATSMHRKYSQSPARGVNTQTDIDNSAINAKCIYHLAAWLMPNFSNCYFNNYKTNFKQANGQSFIVGTPVRILNTCPWIHVSDQVWSGKRNESFADWVKLISKPTACTSVMGRDGYGKSTMVNRYIDFKFTWQNSLNAICSTVLWLST